jgi:hypothetical protein
LSTKTKKKVCDHASCPGGDECPKTPACSCHAKPAPAELSVPTVAVRKLPPIENIRGLLDAFKPGLMKAKVLELTKAGFPGAAFSEGRGNGETPDLVACTPESPDWTPRPPGTPLRGNGGRVLGFADPADRDVLGLQSTVFKKLAQAETAVLAALVAHDKILAAARQKKDDDEIQLDQLWCTSCLRVQNEDGTAHCAPRGEPKQVGADSTLCRWCHDWTQEHLGELPPLRLVALHAASIRITSKHLRELGVE